MSLLTSRGYEEFTSISKYIRRGETNVTQVTENKGTIEERDSRTNKDLSTNSTVAVFALIRIISLFNSPPPPLTIFGQYLNNRTFSNPSLILFVYFLQEINSNIKSYGIIIITIYPVMKYEYIRWKNFRNQMFACLSLFWILFLLKI